MESITAQSGLLTRGYWLLIAVALRFQSPLLLALRLYWLIARKLRRKS